MQRQRKNSHKELKETRNQATPKENSNSDPRRNERQPEKEEQEQKDLHSVAYLTLLTLKNYQEKYNSNFVSLSFPHFVLEKELISDRLYNKNKNRSRRIL